jgi:ATP-dependent Clp protease ATP-binding subunit ClpA
VFERFTQAARQAIVHAREEALTSGSKGTEVRYLLLGILRADPALSSRVLGGVSLEALRERLAQLPPEPPPEFEHGLSRQTKIVLVRAMEAANELHSYAITTEHLLEGVKRASPTVAAALPT